MAYFGLENGASAFPATQAIRYQKRFRERFRDKSVLPLATNREWQGTFKGVGTEVDIPVLPTLHSRKTKPGEKINYDRPKATMEKFTIGRERYIALTLEDEDKLFAGFNIEGPVLEETTKVISEEVETEFWDDIPSKVATANSGNTAGYKSGKYKLGSTTYPVSLFKTDALAGAGTAVTTDAPKMSAVDYLLQLPACIKEQPGGKEKPVRIFVPTVLGYLLQTSELKQADLTGDAVSMLRKDLQVLGNIGGADVIVTDKLPIYTVSSANCYPIIALDTSAITFVEEVKIKDKLQSVEEWGDFHRSKLIYDWFVRYPEFFSVGYVQIG